jgi:thiol:disulfide interchange protein
MRRPWLAVAVAGLLMAGLAQTGEAASRIRWGGSLPTAMAKAKKTNQLVLVDFYADWCGWCKKLDQDTYRNSRVVTLMKQFVPVKLNAEKAGRAAAQKYGVEGFPTIIVLNRNDEVVSQISGYMPPKQFGDHMQAVARKHKNAPK